MTALIINPLCAAMRRATLFLLLVAFLQACSDKAKPSENAELQQLWRLNVAAPTQRFESIYPIVGEGQVLMSAYQQEKLFFLLTDSKTGELRWRFSDTSLRSAPYYNLKALHQQGVYILPLGNTLLALRQTDGTVAWRAQSDGNAEQFLEPDGPAHFMQTLNDWEARRSLVLRFSAADGRADTLLQMPWPDSCKQLLRTPVRLPNGKLLCSSIRINTITRQTQSKWHLMEAETGAEWRSGKAFPDNTEGYGITKQALVLEQKVLFCAYDQLFCLDFSGRELWRDTLPRDMLSSAPVYADGAFFCAMEDGYLYKIKADSGKVLWKAKASGTPSRPVVYKQHIFLLGGADGLLYTFDTSDGRLIRKMESPNHRYRENAFFRRFIGLEESAGTLFLYDGNDLRAYTLKA
ncbi:MAG: PQQ-binding-like beta-propeller repeat protein [Chitinophagales bacterium]|nr:PQQ-binding-like beta-propeller repeat protein [Chitinophagales bacterium]